MCERSKEQRVDLLNLLRLDGAAVTDPVLLQASRVRHEQRDSSGIERLHEQEDEARGYRWESHV